jgi:hypothetical protein
MVVAMSMSSMAFATDSGNEEDVGQVDLEQYQIQLNPDGSLDEEQVEKMNKLTEELFQEEYIYGEIQEDPAGNEEALTDEEEALTDKEEIITDKEDSQ